MNIFYLSGTYLSLFEYMLDIDLIGEVKEKVLEMEDMLKVMCFSEDKTLSSDLNRIVISGGKRLRPILSYMCYRLAGKEEKPILPLMCMLELMHTASLIHDDVIDGAEARRGVSTINFTSGKHRAIQSGDYLLASAMKMLYIYKGTGINEALSNISTQMCYGEFQQMKYLNDLKNQNISTYFTQAGRKTAYLIATSCFTGALAGGMTREEAETLKNYGHNIGMAFQMKDDLLDFAEACETDKNSGQDLRRGIYTYPVLYLKEEGMLKDMELLFEKKEKSEEDIRELTDFIKKNGGVEKTQDMIYSFSLKAIKELDSLPKTRECEALKKLAKELVTRKK